MTGAPYVLATAIVRSRDGRSILDRTAGEPERRFAADPDRMHTAVMALAELGVTVVGTGRTALRLLAEPAAFADAFDVTLVPDAGGTNWAVHDPTATQAATRTVTEFDVDHGRFAGLLRHVILTPPVTPDVPRQMLSASAPARPKDLLLGEVGSTVLAGVPPRFTTAGADFPAKSSQSLLDQSRDSLGTWLAHPLSTWLDRPDGGPAPVTLIITEQDGLTSLGTWFQGLLPTAGRTAAPATWFDRRGTPCPHTVSHPKESSTAAAFRIGAAHCRTIERILTTFRTVSQQAGTGLIETGTARAALLAEEADLTEAVRLLRAWMDDLVAFKTPLPDGWVAVDPATWTPAKLLPLYDPLREEAGDAVASASRLAAALAGRDAFPLADQVGVWATLLDKRAAWLLDEAEADKRFHGTMCTYAALSLMGTAIDVVLAVGSDAASEIRAILTERPGHRFVISMSWSQQAENVAAARTGYRHPVADVLRKEDEDTTLLVASAGNADNALPSLSTLSCALAGNALTVGGCEPAGAVWAGSEQTHGYTLRDSWFPSTGVTVPQVCATTWGREGGFSHRPGTVGTARHAAGRVGVRRWLVPVRADRGGDVRAGVVEVPAPVRVAGARRGGEQRGGSGHGHVRPAGRPRIERRPRIGRRREPGTVSGPPR